MMEAVTNPETGTAAGRRHRRATGWPARPAPRSGSARSAAATTARSRSPSPGSRPPTTRGSWSTSSSRTRRTAAAAAPSAGPAFHKIMSYLLQKYAVPPTGTRRAHAPHRVVTGRPVPSRCVPDHDPAAPRPARWRPRSGTVVDWLGRPAASSVRGTVRRRRPHRRDDQLPARAARRPVRRPGRRPRARGATSPAQAVDGRRRRRAHRPRRAPRLLRPRTLDVPGAGRSSGRGRWSATSPPGSTATPPGGCGWSAVTGTQGKTTTTRLAEAALHRRRECRRR